VSASSARDAARRRYIAEHSTFERAAQLLEDQLLKVLKNEGIPYAHIKVRAKEISSFVKKLRKYGDDCWDKTTDKVGAQLVVHTLGAVQQLFTVLKAGVEGLEYIDKTDKTSSNRDPKVFGYSGLHVQMRFLGITASGNEPIECEIQLRTQTQDAWAYLEHGIVYKPVIDPSPKIKRKIERLSVLVEIFDEEVDSMIAELEQDPRYNSALLLHEAERWFLTFVTEPGENALSLEVIDQVKSSLDAEKPADYAPALAAFVADHRAQIEIALREYGAGSAYEGEFNYVLFTQPESLILWERIQNARLALTNSVRGSEIEPAVAALADVWGMSLPPLE
jgi:putative GTP pyrophosphokinase